MKHPSSAKGTDGAESSQARNVPSTPRPVRGQVRPPYPLAMASGCIFCAIVAGSVPAHVVFDEGELAPDAPDAPLNGAMAFLDQRPLFKGHTLLVPRAHHETLTDLPPTMLAPLFGRAQQLAAAMVDVLGAAGSFVAMNNTVSQSVPHLHVHVVPRRPKDGLKGFFWPRTRYESDEEMAEYAARLRGGLTIG